MHTQHKKKTIDFTKGQNGPAAADTFRASPNDLRAGYGGKALPTGKPENVDVILAHISEGKDCAFGFRADNGEQVFFNSHIMGLFELGEGDAGMTAHVTVMQQDHEDTPWKAVGDPNARLGLSATSGEMHDRLEEAERQLRNLNTLYKANQARLEATEKAVGELMAAPIQAPPEPALEAAPETEPEPDPVLLRRDEYKAAKEWAAWLADNDIGAAPITASGLGGTLSRTEKKSTEPRRFCGSTGKRLFSASTFAEAMENRDQVVSRNRLMLEGD